VSAQQRATLAGPDGGPGSDPGAGPAPDFAQLFDDELIPVIRRMSARSPDVEITGDFEQTRRAVWNGLNAIGAFGLTIPDPATLMTRQLRPALPLAELMGRALYQGAFFDTVLGAELLAAGAILPEECDLAALATGQVAMAVAMREHGGSDPRDPGPIDFGMSGRTVTGTWRFVPHADEADFILVVGRCAHGNNSGLTAAIVPVDQPGVSISRHQDIGRGALFAVKLDRARLLPDGPGPGGMAAAPWSALWSASLARARLRQAAYLAGLCQGALDLTIARARARQVFGQPLARMQAPAFRLAALAAQIEAVRSLVAQACADADAGRDVRLLACQSLLIAADLAVEVTADAIQLHGSYGLLEHCDAQLFYRRAIVESMILGTARQLREHAAALLTCEIG
jgi:alkylation response protein AidB-like acyl-CoA dehydrogenase